MTAPYAVLDIADGAMRRALTAAGTGSIVVRALAIYGSLEMEKGGLADMNELGIREAYKVKSQVVLSSSEAAEMILRVDDIVQCAPRQREQ